MKSANYWIEKLAMQPLPEEGGYYKEIYRSTEKILYHGLPQKYDGDRCTVTNIYYLLPSDEFSAFHVLKSDEAWYFFDGSPLSVHVINCKNEYKIWKMGPDFDGGEIYQLIFPAGCYFGATVDQKDSYALIGCSVAPGFEFQDFATPSCAALLKKFPRHKEIITRLTRK